MIRKMVEHAATNGQEQTRNEQRSRRGGPRGHSSTHSKSCTFKGTSSHGECLSDSCKLYACISVFSDRRESEEYLRLNSMVGKCATANWDRHKNTSKNVSTPVS